jgi:hypothetical protein
VQPIVEVLRLENERRLFGTRRVQGVLKQSLKRSHIPARVWKSSARMKKKLNEKPRHSRRGSLADFPPPFGGFPTTSLLGFAHQ